MKSNSVKRACVAALYLLGCMPFGLAAQTQDASGFTITLAPPAGPIHLDSPIDVTITVTNVSGTERYWRSYRDDTAYRAFRFSLTQEGKEVDKTAFHRYLRGEQRPEDPPKVAATGSVTSPVALGESFTFTVDLKRLFKINGPGAYALSVSRFDEFTKTTLHSDVLNLNIVP